MKCPRCNDCGSVCPKRRPTLRDVKAAPAEYKASLDRCIGRGSLWKYESGTYVKLTRAGADLFA